MLSAGLDADYRLNDYIKLNCGVNYIYVLPTNGKYGYDDFPSKDLLDVKLGICFEY